MDITYAQLKTIENAHKDLLHPKSRKSKLTKFQLFTTLNNSHTASSTMNDLEYIVQNALNKNNTNLLNSLSIVPNFSLSHVEVSSFNFSSQVISIGTLMSIGTKSSTNRTITIEPTVHSILYDVSAYMRITEIPLHLIVNSTYVLENISPLIRYVAIMQSNTSTTIDILADAPCCISDDVVTSLVQSNVNLKFAHPDKVEITHSTFERIKDHIIK